MSVTLSGQTVLAIAQDLFTALVDGEPGAVVARPAGDLTFTDPLHAWVDIVGTTRIRTAVTTEAATARALARILLALEEEEPVTADDVGDVLGELANVIGGNLKGTSHEPTTLTLPVVTTRLQDRGVPPVLEQGMSWRGEGLVVTLWDLGEEAD